MEQKTILVLFALPDEAIDIRIPGYRVVTVIVGKTKATAAMNTMKAILTHKPDYVMLVGSSGSLTMNVGDIVVSTHFIDRNFESRALPGFPFSLPSVVAGELCNDYIVNTGDDFVTDGDPFTGHVCDMETFSVNTACQAERVPFVAVRYVSDIIGQNSVKSWKDKLADMRVELAAYFARQFA